MATARSDAQFRPTRRRRAGARVPRIPRNIKEQIRDRDPNTLLGGERGLDHVGVAVGDLPAARRAYLALGFSRPQAGTLPNGIKNVNFYFGDTTYLELLTYYDRRKSPGVARFVDRYQKGAMFVVFCVFSVEETAAFLKRRGLPTGAPFPGRIETAAFRDRKQPMWHTFFFKKSPIPGDSLFFIAYERALRNFLLAKVKSERLRRRVFSHRNTALGLRAVWMAVRELKVAKGAYEKIGLPSRRRVRQRQLRARGLEVAVGAGAVLLLQPVERRGAVERFLSRRGEGIVGLSIEVEDLDRAQQVVFAGTKLNLDRYRGPYGESILVPPEKTFDVWIELFQPRSSAPPQTGNISSK